MNRLHDHDFHPPLEKTPGAYSDETRPNSSLAVVSLVFGILAWPVLPVLGAIIAVVTGHAALSQIREEGGRLGGRSLARAGMVLGYLQFAILAVFLGFLYWWFQSWPSPDAIRSTRLTVGSSSTSPVVKLADAMDHDDFDLIDARGLNTPGDEVIAFVRDVASPPDDADLALLTTRRLVALDQGRVAAVDLAAITAVEEHRDGSRPGIGPALAVFNRQDLLLGVNLPPGPDGDIFRAVLAAARKVARENGKGISDPP